MNFNIPPVIPPSCVNFQPSEDTEFRPYISKKMKPFFEKIREKILFSLQTSKSIEAGSIGITFESIIKRIDKLAFNALTSDEITPETEAELKCIKTDLQRLQGSLKKATANNDFRQDAGLLQIQREIPTTQQLLTEIEEINQAITHYAAIAKTALNDEELFCIEANIDPLKAIPFLMTWLNNLSILDKKIAASFPLGGAGLAKTQELHELFLERLDTEFETLLTDLEGEIKRHLKQLFFQIRQSDETTKRKGVDQLLALRSCLNDLYESTRHHHLSRRMNNLFSSPLSTLQWHLKAALEKIDAERIKNGQSQELNAPFLYGSREWEQLVLQRPEVPRGLLSRTISYLNPLEYLPEKWRPTSEQITYTCLSVVLLSQDILSFKNRVDQGRLAKQASANQGDFFTEKPEETERRMTKESDLKWDSFKGKVSVLKEESVFPSSVREDIVPHEKTGEKSTIGEAAQSKNVAQNLQQKTSDTTPQTVVNAIRQIFQKITGKASDILPILGVRSRITQDLIAAPENISHTILKGVLDANATLLRLSNFPDTEDLQEELEKLIQTRPSVQDSYVEIADWRSAIHEFMSSAKDIVDRNISFSVSSKRSEEALIHEDLPCGPLTPMLSQVALPKVSAQPLVEEERLREENAAFIHAVIQKPAPVPSSNVYANLIGLNTYEIKNAKINEKEVEATSISYALGLFLESQKTYLEALKEHPQYSSTCRKEICQFIFGDPYFAGLAAQDEKIISDVLDKTTFALSLVSMPRTQRNEVLRNQFKELESGRSFFFPINLNGKKAGHALSLEIEKDHNHQVIVRIFNLGFGANWNQGRSGKALSFVEIVDIAPSKLFDDSILGFLDVLDTPHDFLEIWNQEALYHVFLGSLGGKVTHRKDTSDLLKEFQIVGNCAVASTALVLDKFYQSEALSEKMRAIALYRSTIAYYQAHQSHIGYETASDEGAGWLLNSGARATLDAIEKAIQAGGFIGSEADEMTKEMQELLQNLAELQHLSALKIVNIPLSFEGHPVWTSPLVEVSAIHPVSPFKKLPHQKGISVVKNERYQTGKTQRKVPAHPKQSDFKDPFLADLFAISLSQDRALLINQANSLTDLKLPNLAGTSYDLNEARGIAAAQHAEDLSLSENLAIVSQDPRDYLSIDRLQILLNLIYDSDRLRANLEKDPGLIGSMAKFCHNGQTISTLIQDVGIGSYFAYLAAIFKEAVHAIDPQLDTSQLPDPYTLFQSLIDSSDPLLEKERLKTIHYYRFKSFESKATLTFQESETLLSSVSYLKAHNSISEIQEEIDQHWELVKIAQNGLGGKRQQVNQMLNAIAKAHDLSASRKWIYDSQNNLFYNKEGTAFYTVSTGILSSLTIGRALPPEALKTHSLFADIVKDPHLPLDRVEENVFLYTNAEGSHFRFSINHDAVSIYRQFGKEWFQAITPTERSKFPIPIQTSLREGASLWASVEEVDDILYVGGESFPILRFKNMRGWRFWKNPEWRAELQERSPKDSSLQSTAASLLDPSDSLLGKVISRVEDPAYTFCFSKNGKLFQVNLPRWGLTFKASEKDPFLASQELEGFGLYSNEGEKESPLFSDFIGYLPLKKVESSGKITQGILLPHLPFEKQKAGVLSTPTAVESAPCDWKAQVPYFLYRLEGNLLIPQTSTQSEAIQASLYVANIYLSEKRYLDALNYLNEADLALKVLGSKAPPEIAKKLIRIAHFFAINEDIFPEAAAVRLHAAAMVQRLISLHQIDLLDQADIETVDIEKDYRLYSREIHRIPMALRLSAGKSQLLSIPDDLGILPSESTFQIPHSPISITGSQEIAPIAAQDFQAIPALQKLTFQQMILSTGMPFVDAFPTDIIPLYQLLRNPNALEDSGRRKIARLFGFDETLSPQDLQSRLITLLELRYRFIIDQTRELTAHHFEEDDQTIKQKETLEAWKKELNLLGALINTRRGGAVEKTTMNLRRQPFDPVSLDEAASAHEDLLVSIREATHNRAKLKDYEKIIATCEGYAREEAFALWKQWVEPTFQPIPLSIKKAEELTQTFMGPVVTEDSLKVKEQMSEAGQEELMPAPPFIPTRMPLLAASQPLLPTDWIDTLLEGQEITKPLSTSPFDINPQQPFARRLFRERHREYSKYLKQQSTTVKKYSLKDVEPLREHLDIFRQQIQTITSVNVELETSLLTLLNIHSPIPSVKALERVNLARATRRTLTIADAKTALAMGWNHNYLRKLNPNLDIKSIHQIFDLTLALMLEQREIQRRERSISAISKVLKSSPNNPSWQLLLSHLAEALKEKMLYDPYELPVLLLAEVEYDISLWEQQIPVIKRLALQEQAAYLVELAMALGKTDIISPTMLPLLADGKHLLIYVMPDSLVTSMAPQLQKRAKMGFDMEVRNIPISHEGWTVEKIQSFTEELKHMRDQRIPLVWSSSDVQTCVNAYLQGMDSLVATDIDAPARISAWMGLFSFMRSSALIVGDEIHALLDILTSYNLALGNPESLPKDEMDAIAFFLQTITTHPAVVNNIRLPFVPRNTGSPLTQESFEQSPDPYILSPKQAVIESLMEQGITGDSQAIEAFHVLPNRIKKHVRRYLNSGDVVSYQKIQDTQLLPALDRGALNQLRDGKLSMEDPDVIALIQTLLPSDRPVALSQSSGSKLGNELMEIAEAYEKLDLRIKNFLGTIKESLRLVFVMTANAQLGKHYATNRNQDEAVPADNGTPLYDSQFGSSIERLFYTAFLISQSKISEAIIRQDLEAFVEKYRLKMAEQFGENLELEDLDFQDIPLVKAFHARYGHSCQLKERGFNDVEIQTLTAFINSRIDLQMPLIRDYYFTKLTVYPKEVETTTHIFPSLAKPKVGVRGMSGILYNRPTFPQVFTHTQLSDTIPSVMERLKASSDPQTLTVSLSGDPDEVLHQVFKHSNRGPGSIIDSTGYIQNQDTELYARTMLKLLNKANPVITAVAYYDGNTLKIVKKGVEQSLLFDPSIPRESLAALWDVSHTTGSNILIDPNGHAFFFVGKHIRLFELGQSVMRLRSLGSGQQIVVVVAKEDREVIIGTLNSYLDLQLDNDHILTVEQIIQYALLHEGLEESENNWRAIDMRMRMAIIDPILQHVLWNEKVHPQTAKEAFELAKSLFIKKHITEPWVKYGAPISKLDTKKAKEIRLKNWLNHPVLKAIESHPSSFPNVDIKNIKKHIKQIAREETGPLQTTVDSEEYTGKRQKVRMHTHQMTTTDIKTDLKLQTQIKLHLKEKVVLYQGEKKLLPPLRREPYQTPPVIPLGPETFMSSSYSSTLSIQDLLELTPDLIQSQYRNQTAVSLSDLLGLDPKISNVVGAIDPDISVSLNLAPLWGNKKGVEILYKPYDYFSKIPSHALLVQDTDTNRIHLRLLDLNDALAFTKKLKKDQQDPDLNSEVHLSLYDLRENRIIVSGAAPVNPDGIPQVTEQINALISQAKFLSGNMRYTAKQKEFLLHWINQSGRLPEDLLQIFVLKIALHRSHDLSAFTQTGLAKVFMESGISKKEIQKLVDSPLIKANALMKSLLFDRSLTAKNWLESLTQLNRMVSKMLKDGKGAGLSSLWSHLIPPLLPVLFDLPYFNGAATRMYQDDATISLNDDLSAAALRRRLLMKTFFSDIVDVFYAIKTAVPQISKIDSPYGKEALEILKQTRGVGAFSFRIEALQNQEAQSAPVIVGSDQLETLSELLHPMWGLPAFTDSTGGYFDLIARERRVYGDTWTTSDLVRETTSLVVNPQFDLAKDIALKAIDSLDVVASLEALPDDYEFERLHGLFAFLARLDVNPGARRAYALKMLPRLIAGKLQGDTGFYANFIPKAFTVNPEDYTRQEIEDILSKTYVEGIKHRQQKPYLSLALRAFAKDAPENTALTTANWINDRLKTTPPCSDWLTLLIGQFWIRGDKQPLIDYQLFKNYFQQDPKSIMTATYSWLRDIYRKKNSRFSYPEYHLESLIKLINVDKDLDLFIDISNIPLKNIPVLTVYDKATKWASAFSQFIPANVNEHNTERIFTDLWPKILDPITSEVVQHPPQTEIEKAALRNLVETLDKVSAIMMQSECDEVQHLLGKIRVAAYHDLDFEARKKDALQALRTLHQQSNMQKKILAFSIGNFLIKQEEWPLFKPQEILDLLHDLQHAANGESGDDPDSAKKYSELTQFFDPLLAHGSQETKEAFLTWIDEVLQSGKSNSFITHLISAQLFRDAGQIQHTSLVNYLGQNRQRQEAIIFPIINQKERTREHFFTRPKNIWGIYRITDRDFALFAEITGLKTKGREPIPPETFAKQILPLISSFESYFYENFADIFDALYESAKAAPSFEKEAILEVVKRSDSQIKKKIDTYSVVIALNNLRRLSEFGDRDPSINLQNAIREYFAPESELTPFRQQSLEALFIDQSLLKKTTDATWIEPSLKLITSSNHSVSDLLNLFRYSGDNLLSRIISDYSLESADERTVVLNLLIKMSAEMSKETFRYVKTDFYQAVKNLIVKHKALFPLLIKELAQDANNPNLSSLKDLCDELVNVNWDQV